MGKMDGGGKRELETEDAGYRERKWRRDAWSSTSSGTEWQMKVPWGRTTFSSDQRHRPSLPNPAWLHASRFKRKDQNQEAGNPFCLDVIFHSIVQNRCRKNLTCIFFLRKKELGKGFRLTVAKQSFLLSFQQQGFTWKIHHLSHSESTLSSLYIPNHYLEIQIKYAKTVTIFQKVLQN